MKAINTGRVLLGGIIAAAIINLIETVMNGVVLKSDWAAAMQALGKSGEVTGYAITVYMVAGLIEGIIGVALYAGLISRYGIGTPTAAKAGVVVWALGSVIPSLMWLPAGIIPGRLSAFVVVVDFIAILLGVTMGALLYRDEGASRGQAAGA
jgi:hypothetical protein